MIGQKARVLVPPDMVDYADVILARIRAGEISAAQSTADRLQAPRSSLLQHPGFRLT